MQETKEKKLNEKYEICPICDGRGMLFGFFGKWYRCWKCNGECQLKITNHARQQ